MGKRIAGQEIDPPLTDRERIFLKIIDGLYSTQIRTAHLSEKRESAQFADSSGYMSVHFAYWKKPEPGDLVFGWSGGVSRWKVGWYVEPLSDAMGGAVIREIGTDNLCNYSNESFYPILGLQPSDIFERDQRTLYVKVLKAFSKGDEYSYRFGGLIFESDEAVVTIREVFGGFSSDSVPFTIRFKWTKRTSVASILKIMREGGYGTKSFLPPDWKPPVDLVGDK